MLCRVHKTQIGYTASHIRKRTEFTNSCRPNPTVGRQKGKLEIEMGVPGDEREINFCRSRILIEDFQKYKVSVIFGHQVKILSSQVPEVVGEAPSGTHAAPLSRCQDEQVTEEGEEHVLSVWSRGPWAERHSKMLQFPCTLTAQLCLVKSMNTLQLISGVAAVSCMVSSLDCFSTHLILSTLAA